MGNIEDIENRQSITDTINDLITIHNDRIEGYEKAGAEINEEDEPGLKELFNSMTGQSRQLKLELEALVAANGGEIAKGPLFIGKLYRAWMGFKALVTSGGKRSILSSCETGENAVQDAYDLALANKDLSEEMLTLIQEQQSLLKLSHDMISRLRAKAEAEQRDQSK